MKIMENCQNTVVTSNLTNLEESSSSTAIPNLNEAVPESVTMETLLAYTAEAAKYRSDSRRSSYQNEVARNLKNRRMTRLVMAIGIILLVMSVILVGITLSLSEHIDKMVKQTHQKNAKTDDVTSSSGGNRTFL